MAKLSEILRGRGYVHQFSAGSLEEITDKEKRTLYFGIDPSADSLHIGNLQMLLILRHFHDTGHKVIILVGGGTGMIGDPSGKSEERNLLDATTLKKNTEALKKQIELVSGIPNVQMVNNADWLSRLTLIDFLRDVGKHFTLNSMVKREMVRERLESEVPLSYTEFSYSVLQGYDFLHLFENEKCDLQIGASDQWGNIVSGIELIRKKAGGVAYGVTAPLLVNKVTGKKFGKSEGGAIWLDKEKTSSYTFYQFWLNSADEVVEEYLTKMTLLSLEDIRKVMGEHAKDSSKRTAQHALAGEVTKLVHGKKAVEKAERISQVLFGDSDLGELTDAEKELLIGASPSTNTKEGVSLVDVLITTGLASSKRDARELIQNGGISINGEKMADAEAFLEAVHFQNGIGVLQKGKRDVHIIYQ